MGYVKIVNDPSMEQTLEELWMEEETQEKLSPLTSTIGHKNAKMLAELTLLASFNPY